MTEKEALDLHKLLAKELECPVWIRASTTGPWTVFVTKPEFTLSDLDLMVGQARLLSLEFKIFRWEDQPAARFQ